MATDKPRISFALPDDLKGRIESYLYDNRVKNLSQAVIQLIEKGLEEIEGIPQKEEPATMDGLTDDEQAFMNLFDELSPSNQRLLLGIGAVILQEQQRPPD